MASQCLRVVSSAGFGMTDLAHATRSHSCGASPTDPLRAARMGEHAWRDAVAPTWPWTAWSSAGGSYAAALEAIGAGRRISLTLPAEPSLGSRHWLTSNS